MLPKSKKRSLLFRKLQLLSTYIILYFFLLSCGKVAEVINCKPNFYSGALSLQVSHISGTTSTYNLKVCTNSTPVSQYSVYGTQGLLPINILPHEDHVRSPHRSDGLIVGASFDVTFEFSGTQDIFFFIYQDGPLGELATTQEIARGDLTLVPR